MKKIIILFLVLMLIGCGQREGPSASITEKDVHQGTKGLVINFLEGTPPPMVYENDIFPINIDIKNRGAHDIKEGYILINLEEENMELDDGETRERIKINGKSLGNPEGSSEVFTYLVGAKTLSSELETITSTPRVTACYRYGLLFSENVCVDTDFFNIKKSSKACSSSDSTYSSGQGGPVSITKIEPMMLEDNQVIRPSFNIHLKNEGSGEVINPSKVSDMCSSKTVRSEDINHIKIRAFLSEEELICNPIPLKLRDKDDVVRCTLEQGINKKTTSYTTLLTIELDYGYTETISKTVEIRKII